MAQYYAVERSSEYLAHYGVRGMRWGIRRAIKSGNREALRKQYLKATTKLGKLSLNANRGVQERNFKAARARVISGATASGALSGGLTAITNSHLPIKKRLALSGAAAVAGASAGAILNSKGLSSGFRISDRGHARAIEKRNKWRRDMESAFKGTPYGGKKMRKFHQQITAISDQKDPNAYVSKQYRKAVTEASQARRRKRK